MRLYSTDGPPPLSEPSVYDKETIPKIVVPQSNAVRIERIRPDMYMSILHRRVVCDFGHSRVDRLASSQDLQSATGDRSSQ